MADPAYQKIQEFMNSYDQYKGECSYAVSWMNSIKARATTLQADPNYAIALTVEERAAVEANLQGASEDPIRPVGPPQPVPPRP